jgi:magnesium-transporting ATPase (P-type)
MRYCPGLAQQPSPKRHEKPDGPGGDPQFGPGKPGKVRGRWAYSKVDELPFDFIRRRLSIVVKDSRGDHLLVCKGAVEEMLGIATHVRKAQRRGAGRREALPEQLLALPTSTTRTASACWWWPRATSGPGANSNTMLPLTMNATW